MCVSVSHRERKSVWEGGGGWGGGKGAGGWVFSATKTSPQTLYNYLHVRYILGDI